MGISAAFDAISRLDDGLIGHKLRAHGQLGSDTGYPFSQPTRKDERAIKPVSGIEELCTQERQGWRGYVEWEKYLEKKTKAHKILTSRISPGGRGSMLDSSPGTNQALSSADFEALYAVLGGALASVADDSWEIIRREKHPDMLRHLRFPYNGAPPRGLVASKKVAPNSLHSVRNHGGIPLIDKEKWDLSLDGMVQRPMTFTVDDLMDESRFLRMEKTVTLKCPEPHDLVLASLDGGQDQDVSMSSTRERAIGTARYVGISLRQVIEDCGGLIQPAQHFELFGADTCIQDLDVGNYAASVPWAKVEADEVMLAWEMNGEPLPRTHGYPLRVVVAGGAGAQSVKWLYRIQAVENSSRNSGSGFD